MAMAFEGRAFWISGNWPEDAYGYVFLTRAVDKLGKALFPDEWSGKEPVADSLYCFWTSSNGIKLPFSWQQLSISDKREIHWLLARHRPEFCRSAIIENGPFGPRIAEFSAQEMEAAVELAEIENKKRLPALQRWSTVQRTLKEAIRDEKLSMALLPKQGGAFRTECDASWWNTRDVSRRFYFCQMNPLDPFGIGVAGDGYMHIFIHEGQLQVLTQALVNNSRQSHTVLLPANNDTYEMAVGLLKDWGESAPKKTRDAFAQYCALRGIPSSSAREAYKTLGQKPGKKAAV